MYRFRYGVPGRKMAICVVAAMLLVILPPPSGAIAQGGLSTLQVAVQALEARVLTLETTIAIQDARIITLETQTSALQASIGAQDTRISALETTTASQLAQITTLESQSATLQASLATQDTRVAAIESNSVLTLNGHLSLISQSGRDTAIFERVNVQVVNGSGGTSTAPNGLGNLIVGYNEMQSVIKNENKCTNGVSTTSLDCTSKGYIWIPSFAKGGSHNLIVGPGHIYPFIGGIAFGAENTLMGNFASITGGTRNTARGEWANVVGGTDNVAGYMSLVVGGSQNRATANLSSAIGGTRNVASSYLATVVGGSSNTAAGNGATVSGGFSRKETGEYAWADGTLIQSIQGELAALSSGVANYESRLAAVEANSVIALDGKLRLDSSSGYATALFEGVNVQVVSGSGTTDGPLNGLGNVIVGYNESKTWGQPVCSIIGHVTQAVCEANGGIWSVNQKSGSHNIISGSGHSYVAFGGLAIGTQNLIQGPYSSVSGGYYNTATGYGSVSGGNQNTAGYGAVVSGGIGNTANGYNASVNGGWFNTAQGYASSILGGANIGLIYQNQHFP